MNETRPGPGDPEERLGELLRRTGRRPPVPEERAARVREAVRAHWAAQVTARARRRRSWALAGLATAAALLAAAGLVFVRLDAFTPRAGATVLIVRGGAVTEDGIAVRPGIPLGRGGELITASDGRVTLRVATGHSVRLDSDSAIRVLSRGALALDRGAVYVDSEGLAGRAIEPLELHTPLGIVRELGTRYETRVQEGALRVRVRDGRVAVEGDSPPLEVEAGEELELDAAGRVTRRAIPAFDDAWGWTAEVAPTPEIEGRPLREFLDWAARERGLRVELRRPEDASIRLGGSIHGLTPDQALLAVLPTCRLQHRVEDGRLIVEPAAEP